MRPKSTVGIEYISDSDSLLALPLLCEQCGREIEHENGKVIPVDKNTFPLCEEHKEFADRLVTGEYHYGHPNNNLNPETGEPGWLDSDTVYYWIEIVDETVA